MFEPSLGAGLEASLAKGSPISVLNCQVKAAGLGGGEAEIVASNRSRVESSPRKMEVPTEMRKEEPKGVEMDKLDAVGVNQQVTVLVKALTMSEPENVTTKEGKELKTQDGMIGDTSGCSHVVLWEKDVGALVEGVCYKLLGVTVRCFDGFEVLVCGWKL